MKKKKCPPFFKMSDLNIQRVLVDFYNDDEIDALVNIQYDSTEPIVDVTDQYTVVVEIWIPILTML
jgi:hypothetical protein